MNEQPQSGESEAQKEAQRLLSELKQAQNKAASGDSSSRLNTMRAVSLLILLLICIAALWFLSRGMEMLPDALEKKRLNGELPVTHAEEVSQAAETTPSETTPSEASPAAP